MKALGNVAMFAAMFALAWVPTSPADVIQTDWSGGGGLTGPVTDWTRRFDAAAGVSWLAVPGQVALASQAVVPAVPHLLADAQDGAFGIDGVDIDGDGDTDIVTASETSGDLLVWINDGAGTPTFTPHPVDDAYGEVAAASAADLDGDGDLDLVATTGAIGSRITCYLNGGGSPPAWTPVNLETNWSQAWEIATGDVDGDGHIDVIGTNLTLGDVVWWRNDGNVPMGWTRHVVDAAVNGAHSARAGDIDGDGRADILATGTTSQQVAWWRNEGGDPVTWTKHVITTGFFGGRSVRLGDIDGDGDLDALACGFDARVLWFANLGGNPVAWSAQLITGALGQAHQVQLADVSGDGRLDVVVAGYGGNAVAWFENGGGTMPIAWTRRNVDTALPRPLAVGTGDVDGDGALEVLASSNTTDLFRWYDASTFVGAGELTGSILDAGAGGALTLDWVAEVPAGADLQFVVRGGEAPEALGPWSAPISTPGTELEPLGRYVQYKVLLATADPAVSPQLSEVAVRQSLAPVPGVEQGLEMGVFPNPANPRAVITFDLPRADEVRLELFDLRGNLVRRLVEGPHAAGRHAAAWDGTDDGGRAVASGSYFARLATPQGTLRTRVTLLR